ncbi:MAG: protein kinase, partial [Myxococcota bacterium]
VFLGMMGRNTPPRDSIPHRFSEVYTTTTDNQSEVRIKVFQGEDRYTKGNHSLGEFVLTGIREAMRREPQIDVTFHLDANGVLQVSAIDMDTGSAQAIEIRNVVENPVDDTPAAQEIREGGYTKAGGRTRDLGKYGLNALNTRQAPSSPSQPAMPAYGAVHGNDSGSLFADPQGPATGGSVESDSNLDQMPNLMPGTLLGGRYQLEAAVGAGAFGVVYRAKDMVTGTVFALKTLMPGATQADEAAVERFRREAELMARFDHPNLVQTVDFGRTDDGGLFMVMEFVDGRTLHQMLKEEKRFEPTRAVHIIRQTLLGLEEAHGQGVIHRDLKPGNIMVYDGDAFDQVKLLDFGVAKMVAGEQGDRPMEELTTAGKVLGTPRYIAPEQLATGGGGGHYPSSDVYSLGLILYRMVTGRRAIRGNTIPEILAEQVSPQPVIDDHDPLVPPPLFHVLRSATEKDWNRRYADASAFRQALDQVDMEALGRWQSPVPVDGYPEALAMEPAEGGDGHAAQQPKDKVRSAGFFRSLFKK